MGQAVNDSRMRDGLVQRGKTWSYVVRELDSRTGKTKPRWVGGFATRAAARKARDQARHAINRGTYVAPQSLTVGEFLDRWIDAHSVSLKPSTAQSYRANIERYLKPAVGREPLQFLSPARLSAVFKKLYEGGGAKGNPLSPRTVEFARAVLRRAMQDAVMDRLIDANPVVGTKRPRVGKPGPRNMDRRATTDLLEPRRRDALVTTVDPRRRNRDASRRTDGLRWDDVDLDAGMVHVEHSVTYQGRKRTTATPKNHERRDVAIDPHTVTALRSWRTRQAGERLAWGEAYRDVEGLLFTWEDGTPVHPDYASKTFIKSQ